MWEDVLRNSSEPLIKYLLNELFYVGIRLNSLSGICFLLQVQHFESLFQNDHRLTTTARNITREWMVKEVQKFYFLKGGHAQKKLKEGGQRKEAFNQLGLYTVIKSMILFIFGHERIIFSTLSVKKIKGMIN